MVNEEGFENKPQSALTVTNSNLLPKQFLAQHGFQDGVPFTRNKVSIIGFAPSSMGDARAYFGDPSFEHWGLNQLYLQFPQLTNFATRWFQIHPRREYDMAVRDHKHHDWLGEQLAYPIYMQDTIDDIPMSIPYPKDEILKYFGRYFTNSISWMIALAVYETMLARKIGRTGFTDIYIFGVDMATNEEYVEQRPSCEFFVGWARGMGINVYIPPQSDLCKTAWLYPFEDDSLMRQKMDGRRKELRSRVEQHSAQEQQNHDMRIQILGALENTNYIEQTWLHNRKALTYMEGKGYDVLPSSEPTQQPVNTPVVKPDESGQIQIQVDPDGKILDSQGQLLGVIDQSNMPVEVPQGVVAATTPKKQVGDSEIIIDPVGKPVVTPKVPATTDGNLYDAIFPKEKAEEGFAQTTTEVKKVKNDGST